MIPFGSYLLAEHLHCSGILAAVASGLAMGPSETAGEVGAITGIRRTTIWDTIQFAANGIIFVLLGEQLPELLSGAVAIVQSIGHRDPWWLALYVVAINVGLAVLRFLWVWLSFSLTLFRQGHWRRVPNWRIVAAMSFCGVRGATTLAGVLTLPLAMSDGSAFPSRELAIFLAMGVIITSLIVASIDLPLLLRGLSLPPEPSHLAQENAVRIAAAEAAVGLLLGKLFNSGDDALKILLPTSVPLVFLAGFAWPLQSMPGWLSALAWFSPATCAMHIFVPINQMGASLEDVFGPLAKLMALLALYGGLNIWSSINSAR